MNRWISRTRLFWVLAGLALIAAAFVVYVRFIADYPAAQATLTLRNGKARITRGPAATLEAAPDDQNVQVGAGETIEMNGWAALTFADGTVSELFPGTRLRIDRLGRQDDQVQLTLTLLAGQIVNRVGHLADRRAFHRMTLTSALSAEAASAEYTASSNAGRTLIGAVSGALLIKTNADTLLVPPGSGITAEGGKVQGAPQPWSYIRAPTYRPDGSVAVLEVTLARQNPPDTFTFLSDQLFLAPDGVYAIQADTTQPYTLSKVALPPGKLTEIPITLGEVVFKLLDENGKLLPVPTILIADSRGERVPPDTPILVGPGAFTLNVARADAPDLTQSTGKVDVQPGQRLPISLHSDLFGAGMLQISVIGVDGSPQSANVAAYAEGSDENAPPPISFKSDDPPQQIARGRYAVIVAVRSSIAARYVLDIKTGQTTTQKVELGTLKVNFTDAAGHPMSRLVFVASKAEMARLNLPIDQMRQKIYGYALNTGQSITVPAGSYLVQVNDQHTAAQTVTVTPGQNTPITITAGTSP